MPSLPTRPGHDNAPRPDPGHTTPTATPQGARNRLFREARKEEQKHVLRRLPDRSRSRRVGPPRTSLDQHRSVARRRGSHQSVPKPPRPRTSAMSGNSLTARNREGLGTSRCDGIAWSRDDIFLRPRTMAQAGTGWPGSRLKLLLPVSGAPGRAAPEHHATETARLAAHPV